MHTLMDLAEVKQYLEVTHGDHDNMIEAMIEAAEQRFASYTGAPLTATVFSELYHGNVKRIILNHKPVGRILEVIDTQATATGTDDATLESWNYRVDPKAGLLHYTADVGAVYWWPVGMYRWMVRYTAGWEFHPRWSADVETVRMSLHLLIYHWYENRNAGVSSVNEAGLGSSYWGKPLPPEVCAMWEPYRPLMGVGGEGIES